MEKQVEEKLGDASVVFLKKNYRSVPFDFGFTLVELMIAVAILGFGLVIAIQAYMISARALNACQNYIEVSGFAREKCAELELASYQEPGFDYSKHADSGEVSLNNRRFKWEMRMENIQEPDYLAEKAVLAYVLLRWKEQNIDKSLVVATYLPKKEEEKQEAN
jgi:prepilin-type N-terminal cleavage/methylation domain-containing protein